MYDIFECKNVLIGFLNELGNFKKKKIYISKCKDLLHFTAKCNKNFKSHIPLKMENIGARNHQNLLAIGILKKNSSMTRDLKPILNFN